MRPILRLARGTFAPAAVVVSTPVLAHHPMDGAIPDSVASGLLSGLGHPLIEPGHLLFLFGAAFLVGLSTLPWRRALPALVVFVLASTVGTLLTSVLMPGGAVNLAVAASLVALAALLWARRLPSSQLAPFLPILAGLVHGLAYGESIVGAEPTPILAYLAGLAVVQAAMLIALCVAIRQFKPAEDPANSVASRIVAAAIAATGLGLAIAGA